MDKEFLYPTRLHRSTLSPTASIGQQKGPHGLLFVTRCPQFIKSLFWEVGHCGF